MSSETATVSEPDRNRVPASFGQMLVFMVRRPGPWTILLMILAAALWKTVWGRWDWIDGAILAGFVMLRGFIEWAIHAYLYHALPLPIVGWRLHSSVSEAHDRHHQAPRDYDTFLVTHRGVLATGAVVFLVATIISWSPDRGASALFGFMLVVLAIEVVHLMAHSRIYPRNGFLRSLITLHRMHHYTHGKAVYGVSSTLADRCFGTYPRHRAGRR